MIVTCERCATQFQLDDSRIPDGGVRVRCSRCKHAFEIRKHAPLPQASPSDDEESDWQFNEDPPRGGGGAAARGSAASAVDDLLRAGDEDESESLFGGDASSGLELRVDDESLAAPPAADPPDAPDPRPVAAPPRDASPVPMPEAGESGLDLADDPPPQPRKPASKPLVIHPDPPPVATGDHDPVGDLANALAGELESAAAPDAATGSADADELSPVDWDRLATSDSDLGTRIRTPSVEPDALIDDRPRWRMAVERVGQSAGALVVAALFGFGLYGGLLPGASIASEPPAASDAPGVALRELRGRFVDHAELGLVYVVSGRLENTGAQPVRTGTLGVAVIDHEGRPLVPPIQAAAPLSSEAIREGRIHGAWRQSPALRPGESRSFQAVLGPLPAGAQQVRLLRVEPALAAAPPEATSGSPEPAERSNADSPAPIAGAGPSPAVREAIADAPTEAPAVPTPPAARAQ